MQIKKSNFSEWYNTVISEAGLCDLRYNIKGFIVFMPWAVMTIKKMYARYEKELENKGHLPALFPALIPEEYLLKESEHVAGFVPEVFWVTHAGNEKLEHRYAMRPTSETAIFPVYHLWVNGLKDLPIKIYHSCQVWRHETKATKPFIRSREFHWIETHNAFATRAGAEAQVQEDMETTEDILHNEWGIPFLFFKRPEWDKFAGAVATYAADSLLPDGKVLQLPSTHMLGQNFSKPFDIKYTDSKGKQQYVWQTCYGPAISRIYAALIANHGDEKGLILPFDLAPVQIVIIPIYKAENRAIVDEKCNEVKETLSKYRVVLDSGEETPGYKFNKWELKGVPIRIDLGERDIVDNSLIIKRRDTGEKIKAKLNTMPDLLYHGLLEKIEELRQEIDNNLRNRADIDFKNRINNTNSISELNRLLDEKGGFVKIPFCTDQMEGKECATVLKEKCKANVRGSLYDSKETPKNEKCIACGKKAMVYLYTARQY